MQKNFTKKIIILSFCAIAACKTNTISPYIISRAPEIQALEKQDHQLCTSLKLNTDKANNLESVFYWRCRLSFAKYRLGTNSSNSQQTKHDFDISDLAAQISLKITKLSESFISLENKKIDNRQHTQCLNMGFVFDSEDQAKVDEYFYCRKALIEEQQLIPPYGNTDYLKYPNSEYNIGFAVDQRIEEALKEYNLRKEKYPTCVKFNLHSKNFENCTEAQEKSRQCFVEIDRKKFQKEWEEKIACQKQAYVRFDSNMLKEKDQSQEDIDRMNANSDFYNKHSFAAIGVDGTLFSAEEKIPEKSEDEKKKEKEERAKKINSKSGLYTKFELTKLRKKYIFACQQNTAKAIDQYVEELKKSCDDEKKFDVIGDE